MEKPLVLLADDNEATSTLITALLQKEFAVEVAGDGSEAIEKLKRRQYAAVLLDLLMPVVDGFAVLDFIKNERPDLMGRVLVVTAAFSARDTQRVREYDVCGVIRKPFEVENLFAAVQQCAAGAGSPSMRGPIVSSGMILLLAEMLVRRV